MVYFLYPISCLFPTCALLMRGLVLNTMYSDSVMPHCIFSHADLVVGELYALDALPVTPGITSDW